MCAQQNHLKKVFARKVQMGKIVYPCEEVISATSLFFVGMVTYTLWFIRIPNVLLSLNIFKFSGFESQISLRLFLSVKEV